MFTNGLNMDLPLRAWIKKIAHGVKIVWLSGNETVLGAVINKEDHTDCLLKHEKAYRYWFP